MAKYSYPVDFEGTFWTIIDGDFYVSTIGNDITGDGSPKNPFLTVHRAFVLAVDGEKIVIGPDEYIRVDASLAAANTSGSEVPCRVATTANISLASGGLFTIDGILTAGGDRVLVWNQNVPTENGIYIVSANVWERATDFNNPDNIIPGKLIPILEGNQHGNEVFQLTTTDDIVVGTTALSFEKVAISHWGEIQGDIAVQTDLVSKISTDIQVAVDALKDTVPTTGDTLKKLYDLIQGVVGVSRSVATFADLPADGKDQENIFVQDASGDSTVTSGWAIYKSIGDQPGGTFVKIAEQEGLDVQVGVAAGSNRTIQYNSNGAFGATDDLTFNPATGGGTMVFGPSIDQKLSLSRISDLASISIREALTNSLALRITNDGGNFGAIYLYGGGGLRIRFTTQGIFSFIDTGYSFGIGTNSPHSETVLSLGGTSSITLPKGTTAQRPATPTNSMVRFNTDTNTFEGYDGIQWGAIGGGGATEERIMFDSNLDTVREIYYNGILTFGTFSIDTVRLASIAFETSTDGATWTSHGTIMGSGTPPSALNTWVGANGSGNWYLRLSVIYKTGQMRATGAQWKFTR